MAIIMRTLRIMASIGIVLRFICAAVPNLANAEDDEERVVTAEERAALRARQSPIPLQAAVCDIVGVGTVTGAVVGAFNCKYEKDAPESAKVAGAASSVRT